MLAARLCRLTALRPLSKTVLVLPLRISHHRHFSSTLFRRAEDDAGTSATGYPPLFQKIMANPETMTALKDLGEIMTQAGIPPGQTPTLPQMMKLQMNKEFRERAVRLRDEMKKAGIDVESKETVEEFMAIVQSPPKF